MASDGRILIDATYHTNLHSGLNDIIATSLTVGKNTGSVTRLQTAEELLNQCRTYTLHINKMIYEDGEDLPSHAAFVDGMKAELEQYDHRSSLSEYSPQQLAGRRGILKSNMTLAINGQRS